VDRVDYDALGSGRLCFERLVFSGSGDGVFVIDASARRAWGFAASGNYVGGLFQEPAISPDGLRIAYSSLTDLVTFYDIYTIPTDGGLPAQASRGAEQDFLPFWTPWSELRWGGDTSRRTVSVTGAQAFAQGGRLYAGAVPRDERPQSWLDAPAFSPDGTELAWVRARNANTVATSMDIVVADPKGDQPETIATLPLPGGLMNWSGGNNLSLAWSPDGRRLAFNRPESATTGHVFVVSRDGSRLTQITSAPGVGDRSVSWSYLPRP
jgi:Tol biopolymer transport system component